MVTSEACLGQEGLVYSREVPRHLPRTAEGRPVHHSTVLRWMKRGVSGVRLEAVRVGRRWATSMEALDRFLHALASSAEAPPMDAPPPQRHRAARARRSLEEEGL